MRIALRSVSRDGVDLEDIERCRSPELEAYTLNGGGKHGTNSDLSDSVSNSFRVSIRPQRERGAAIRTRPDRGACRRYVLMGEIAQQFEECAKRAPSR